MREKVEYFTADYRDGRVHIGGKVYQAGYFATHLLNQYYENDTAARISMFTLDNWILERNLERGYLYPPMFINAGKDILNIFTALPWLRPFNLLDVNSERERVAKLFTEGLSRAPLGEEYARYITQLEKKGCTVATLKELVKDIFSGKEFSSLKLNDKQAAFAVYRAVLNRDPIKKEIDKFKASQATNTALSLLDTEEFKELMPMIVEGPYFWGNNNASSFTGDKVMTSSEVNKLLASKEKVIALPQGTLVLVTESIRIPSGKTLCTEGMPRHYTQMARFLRTNNVEYDTVILDGGGELKNVWVDGNRSAFKKYMTLAYGRNVTLNNMENTVQACRVNDAIAPTNVFGADFGLNHYIADNLITCYASNHLRGWQDGITWAAAQSLIERNSVVDATDVGIVLFRYASQNSSQNTIIRDNTIINVGNSAYGGFDTDAWYDADIVWRYEGSVFYNNQLWTSKRAHMHIAISLASVAWHAANGDTMTGMSAYNNYTPEGCSIVCSCGIAVDSVKDATVRGNQLKLFIGDWASMIPPRIYSLNENTASGEMQSGYENLAMYKGGQPFIIAGVQNEMATSMKLEEAYIMETFTNIPIESFQS